MPQTGLLVAGIFKCFCSLYFSDENDMINHAILAHKVNLPRLHPLIYCASLNDNASQEISEVVYSEYACSSKTEGTLEIDIGNFVDPISTQTTEKYFRCGSRHCKEYFTSMDGLRNHMREPHINTRLIPPCPSKDCKEIFHSKGKLGKHSWTTHGIKAFTCKEPDCNKSYVYAHGLRDHKRGHGNNSFKCDSCHSNRFSHASLQRHKNICKKKIEKHNLFNRSNLKSNTTRQTPQNHIHWDDSRGNHLEIKVVN